MRESIVKTEEKHACERVIIADLVSCNWEKRLKREKSGEILRTMAFAGETRRLRGRRLDREGTSTWRAAE